MIESKQWRHQQQKQLRRDVFVKITTKYRWLSIKIENISLLWLDKSFDFNITSSFVLFRLDQNVNQALQSEVQNCTFLGIVPAILYSMRNVLFNVSKGWTAQK